MREPSNYDLIVPSRSSSDAADKHHNSASDKQLGENNVWQDLLSRDLKKSFPLVNFIPCWIELQIRNKLFIRIICGNFEILLSWRGAGAMDRLIMDKYVGVMTLEGHFSV